MSTLFAMSQVALFGRGLSRNSSSNNNNNPTPAPATTAGIANTSSTGNTDSSTSTGRPPSTSPSTVTAAPPPVEWAMPQPSASAGQPARWRINSADLEDMMKRAAVGLGFDRSNHGAKADQQRQKQQRHQQQQQQQQQQGSGPFSGGQDLVDKVALIEPLSGLLAPASNGTGSSPLYAKHQSLGGEYALDATAPSSPCTPSVPVNHNSGLSVVSPTSSRSEEAAFQHQLSPQSVRHTVLTPVMPSRVSTQQQQPSQSGRFGLKLLVSNSMAGTLIGKGGTRICEIKDECLADIKVTPNGRFYPGTHERVVLVVGEPSAVQLACDRIVTTIYTAADTSLDITQRVLIPDAASGLIIGHDGGRLGDLRQEAGVASIQVSPRDMCTVAGERVVTLQGPMSAVIYGLSLIVNRMMEDTTASRYQNMSTIYRAVHLHLPPYAVPGGGSPGNMHDQHQQHQHGPAGGSPGRHPHGRSSPAYGGPHPHSQDFHSPGTVAGPRGPAPREYNNGHSACSSWEYGFGAPSRDFNGPAEYMHHQHRASGGVAPTNGGAHDVSGSMLPSHLSGGRHLRQAPSPNDFVDGPEGKYVGNGGSTDFSGVVDNCGRSMIRPREYDSPPHCRGDFSPTENSYEQVRQNNPAAHGRGGGGGGAFDRGAYPGDAQVDTSGNAFHPLQQQQRRLRQQQAQQQHLSRSASEYAVDSNSRLGGMLPLEVRASNATATPSHRIIHDASQGQDRMGSSAVGGELRRVPSAGNSGHVHGGDASLSAMFDGMNISTPPGMPVPSVGSQQLQQQGQGNGGGGGGAASGAGVIMHGELPVPDADVGIILGKGGATVRELQQLSGAKIMIARRNEFMPGTKHRLVTLAGPPMSVNMARFLIMRKIQTEKEKL